jgi:hypothetical protein
MSPAWTEVGLIRVADAKELSSFSFSGSGTGDSNQCSRPHSCANSIILNPAVQKPLIADCTDNNRRRERRERLYSLTLSVPARSNATSSTSVFSVKSVVQTAFFRMIWWSVLYNDDKMASFGPCIVARQISHITLFGLKIARSEDHTVPKMAGSIRIPHPRAAFHEVVRRQAPDHRYSRRISVLCWRQ